MGLDGTQPRFHKLPLWPGSRGTVGNVVLVGKAIPNQDGAIPVRSVVGTSVPVRTVSTMIPITTMNVGFQVQKLSVNVNALTSVRISN